MYSCVERARIHKRSRQIRWLYFDGYSRKSACRAIGKRGDPLKNVLYRVCTDIAKKNATTGPCTYWSAFVGYIKEKGSISDLMYCELPSHCFVRTYKACARTYSCVRTDPRVQTCTYRLVRTAPYVQTRPYKLIDFSDEK